jgi:glycosyltransferase involved in cell wall biosynthesis
MRVGLDITQGIKRKARGIARYIHEILPPLLDHSRESADFDPVLYVRANRIFRRKAISRLRENAPLRWMPLRLFLAGGGLDLFHSFGNYLPVGSRVPLTLTVHDLRVLDLEESSQGMRLRRNVARSSGILCLTEHGRGRLLHHFPDYDPERVSVVPHGVDHRRFKPMPRSRAHEVAMRHGLRPPYLLQLGSWFPHKNLEQSIEAFARSRACKEGLRLACVGGGASTEYRTALDELAQKNKVRDRIDWVEDAPSRDIPALVAAASCLLQPSRYEGFALPLLEAMAVGTPGVVSDSSCLPEVSGGVWPVTGQDDPEAFALGIDKVVLDQDARDLAIRTGFAHAAQFTWPATAQKTIEFFGQIIKMGRT